MEENQYQKLYHINNSKQTQVKGNQLEEKAKMVTMGSIESKYYDYEEDVYSLGFRTRMFRQGMTKDLDSKEIEKYLKNPQKNKNQLNQLSKWFYVSNGDVFQLYDLARVLSTLDYTISCIDKNDKKYEDNLKKISKNLRIVRHKEVTRDIISQLISTGTVCGVWLGEKDNIYPFIFDNLEYIFPAYRENGKWKVWFDLAYLDKFSDVERSSYINQLKPYITQKDYDTYKITPEKCRYIEFPIERSFCLRTHTLTRNQRFGIPWAIQSIMDLQHKKKLKDLEKTVANKIINATAILTIGDEKNPNLKMGKKTKMKVFGGVKKALLDSEENGGVSVVGIPEFAKLEFEKVGKEPLDPDKFESVNSDIQNGLGYAKGLITGNEGTYASNNLSLQIFYLKLSDILESIETEVYDKFINLTLNNKKYLDSYFLEYDKTMPLDKKTKLNTLFKLESQGFAIKPIIEILGIDYLSYINQSKFEIETMKLRDEIFPPTTSYTLSKESNNNTKPQDESNENDSTVTSKENDANNMPKSK